MQPAIYCDKMQISAMNKQNHSWRTLNCRSGGFCEVSLRQVSPQGSRWGCFLPTAFLETPENRKKFSPPQITENHASMTCCGLLDFLRVPSCESKFNKMLSGFPHNQKYCSVSIYFNSLTLKLKFKKTTQSFQKENCLYYFYGYWYIWKTTVIRFGHINDWHYILKLFSMHQTISKDEKHKWCVIVLLHHIRYCLFIWKA